jgi:hypothetical protein
MVCSKDTFKIKKKYICDVTLKHLLYVSVKYEYVCLKSKIK